MDRINTNDGLFAAGNPQTGVPGTIVTAEWLNAIQEEVVNVIVGAGMELNPGDRTQLRKAIDFYANRSGLLVVPTTPVVKASSRLIFVEDQESFMRWVETPYYTGYRSLLCGEAGLSAYPEPRPGMIEAEGDVIEAGDAPSLIAWFKETGKLKPIEDWIEGEYFLGDMGGGLYRLPDLRNQFFRATGTDVDTANVRQLGTGQADALQNIEGEFQVGFNHRHAVQNTSGVFFGKENRSDIPSVSNGTSPGAVAAGFDASLVARTSSETRSANIAFHPVINL